MSPTRWSIFLFASLLYFVGYFHRVSLTIVVAELMRDFSASATSIGFLSSLYFYSYAAMQIPAGLLVDSFGPRKTLASFCFLASLGTLIFSISPSLPFAMLGRTFIGLGVSVAFLCTTNLIASWYSVKSFASLTGVLVSIGNLGAIAASAPLAILVTSLGWRFSFAAIAIATCTLAIAIWAQVRDKPERGSSALPQSSLSNDLPIEGKWGSMTGVWLSFRNRDFWFTAFPPFFFFGSFVSLQGLWGVPYLTQVYGVSRVDASLLIMMISAGFCLGAMFWGLVSDRLMISRNKIYSFCTILYTATWLLLTFLPDEEVGAHLPALLFLLGFFFGVMPISIVMVKERFPGRIMGAATGSANVFPFIGAALYQLLIGYVLDTFGLVSVVEGVRTFSRASYRLGFLVCLASLIPATAMALLIREPKETRNQQNNIDLMDPHIAH